MKHALATAVLAGVVAACGLPSGEVVVRACRVPAFGVDAAHVYWIDGCTHELWAWDKQTDVKTRLAQRSGPPLPYERELLVVDDPDEVFWKTADGIMAVRKDGTGERLVYAGGTALATDATDLYVLASGALLRLPRAGGDPVTLANGFTGGSILDSAGVVLVDDTAIYVSAVDAIWQVLKNGIAGKTAVAAAVDPSTAMVMDDFAIYWASLADRRVHCQSKNGNSGCDGGLLNPVHDVYLPVAVAVDERDVYWLTRYYGTVKRVSKARVGVEDVAESGAIGVGFLAVDATHVYWTTQDDGETSSIRRVPKR